MKLQLTNTKSNKRDADHRNGTGKSERDMMKEAVVHLTENTTGTGSPAASAQAGPSHGKKR
jgi:hypothetical protein